MPGIFRLASTVRRVPVKFMPESEAMVLPSVTRTKTMQTIAAGYRSMSLLVSINWDRLLYICTIVFALFFGGWLGVFLH